MRDNINQKDLTVPEKERTPVMRNSKVLFPVKHETEKTTPEPEGAAEPEIERRPFGIASVTDMIFMTRRKIYILSLVLMIVFTSAGLCLYFREADKASVAYNAFLKFEKAPDLKNAFSACCFEVLFAFILFAFGLTAFAPLACVSFLSYCFLRYGYYSAVFFEKISDCGRGTLLPAGYFLLASLSAFASVFYAAEVWKFSEISSEGISRAFKAENFMPYLVDLLLYLTVAVAVSFFMILII